MPKTIWTVFFLRHSANWFQLNWTTFVLTASKKLGHSSEHGTSWTATATQGFRDWARRTQSLLW